VHLGGAFWCRKSQLIGAEKVVHCGGDVLLLSSALVSLLGCKAFPRPDSMTKVCGVLA
jgi:hypothetical protein